MTQGNLYGEAKRDSIAYVYKKKLKASFMCLILEFQESKIKRHQL